MAFKGFSDHHYPLKIIMPKGDYLRNEDGEINELLGPISDSGSISAVRAKDPKFYWD